jgi:hypothetical protein
MERVSYFIKDKALFGGYPNQELVNELENLGVKYFIDLTFSNEKKIIKFYTNQKYINFPIKDQKLPIDLNKFSIFIKK